MLPARFLDIAASAALRVFGGDAVAAAEFLAGERKRKPGVQFFVEFLEGYYGIDDPISVNAREMGIYVAAMELHGDDIDLTPQQAQKILGFEAKTKDRNIDALFEYSYRKQILDAYKVFLADKTKSEFKKFIAELVAQRKVESQVSSQNEDEESYVDGLVTEARELAKTGFFLKIEPRGARKIHAAIAVVFGTRLSKGITEKTVARYAKVADNYAIDDDDSEDGEFLAAQPPTSRQRTADESPQHPTVNTSNTKPASEESSDASSSSTEEFSPFTEEPLGYSTRQSQEYAQREDDDSPPPDPKGSLSWRELGIAAEELGEDFSLPEGELPLGVDHDEFERVRIARVADDYSLDYDNSELSDDLKTFLSVMVRDRAIEVFKNDANNLPTLARFKGVLDLNRGWPTPEWVTSGYAAYVGPLQENEVPPSSQRVSDEFDSLPPMTDSDDDDGSASDSDTVVDEFPATVSGNEPNDEELLKLKIRRRDSSEPIVKPVEVKSPVAKGQFDSPTDKKHYLPYVLMLKREDGSKRQLNEVVGVLGNKLKTLPPSSDSFNRWKKEDLSGVDELPDARDMQQVFSKLRSPYGDYDFALRRAIGRMIKRDKRASVYERVVLMDAAADAIYVADYDGDDLDPIAQGIVEAYGDRHRGTLKDEFTAVRRALREIRAAKAPKVKGARTGGKNTGASKPREPAKPADETGGKEVIDMSSSPTALKYLKMLGYSSVPRTDRTNFAASGAAGLTNPQIGEILGISKDALDKKRSVAKTQTPDYWRKLKLPSVAERIRVFNQYLYPEISKKRGAFFRFAIWKAIENARIIDKTGVFEMATGKKPADDELNLSDPKIGDVKFSKNGKLAVAFAANIVDAVLDEMEQARAEREAKVIDLSAALVLSRGNEALAARLLARLG